MRSSSAILKFPAPGTCLLLFVAQLLPLPPTDGEMPPMNAPCTSDPCISGLTCIEYEPNLKVCDCEKPTDQDNCNCKITIGNKTMTYRQWGKKEKDCFAQNGDFCKKDSKLTHEMCIDGFTCKDLKTSQVYGFCRRSSASSVKFTGILLLLVQIIFFVGYRSM